MPEPLNPLLYERLRRVFGHIIIANQGVAMVAHESPDVFDPEKTRLDIEVTGETYRLSCPFCDDTRNRLYVNHMYGHKTEAGRRLTFLAICFNEACMANLDNRLDFNDKLAALANDLEEARIKPGKHIDPSKIKARMPGPCKLLADLPKQHKARQYIKARGLDPDVISNYYKVSYCLDSMYFMARERIVVPVYQGGKLFGWQARYVGELDWKNPLKKHLLPPKYFTSPGFSRGAILPNLDNAKKFKTGIIVEGWFDVFGFGPMSMPVMGNTISDRQQRDFIATFGRKGRSGILLLDPEEFDSRSTRRAVENLSRRMSGHFAAIKLPEGTDPGSLDRDFSRDFVIEQAAELGVSVSYNKVKEKNDCK